MFKKILFCLALAITSAQAQVVNFGSQGVGNASGGVLPSGNNNFTGINSFTGPLSVSGRITAPPALRQVATRGQIPGHLGSWLQCMTRSSHVARDSITSLQIAYPSWAGTASNGETNAPSALTIQASVEYPAGTFTQVKWASSITNVQNPGQSALSDAVSVTIPNGAIFWLRAYIVTATGTNGMPYTGEGLANTGPIAAAMGDALNCGSSVSNLTTSGTVVDNQSATNMIYPDVIAATTTNSATCIIGDSIAWGYRDTPAYYGGATGIIARSLDPYMGYINLGVFGDSLNGFVNGHANRLALAQYCNNVIVETGINDITAAFGKVTVKANLQTVWGYFSGKAVYQTTFTPYSTSTDQFYTVGNQTPSAYDNDRIDVNAWLLSPMSASLSGVIDVAGQVENYINGGKWAILGPQCSAGQGYCQLTYDGIHPNYQADYLVQKSGVVMSALTQGKYR